VEEARGRCRGAEVLLGQRKLAGKIGNDDTDSATPAATETGDVGLHVRTMQTSYRETQGRLGLRFSEKKNEIERGSGGGLQLVLIMEMVAV
jgi:hypothetical protein